MHAAGCSPTPYSLPVVQALLHHESPGVRQGGAAARGPAASLWAHVPEAVGRGVLGRVRSLWTGVGACHVVRVCSFTSSSHGELCRLGLVGTLRRQ